MADYITKIRTNEGDKLIDYGSLANKPSIDTTLTKSGSIADAKATGDAIKNISNNLSLDKIGAAPANHTHTLTELGITATASELNKLDGITATVAELNKLDGITATTAELNYVDGVTSNIQTQLNNLNTNKAPTSHASTATTYGVSSASNYGHAMASGTTPKENGTAAVGSETAKFARGDHVHPLQTTVSGNAGTATKLATARTVRTNLASTSTASFDGSANITPGVTGTLGLGNGGTGATSADGAIRKLFTVVSSAPTTVTNDVWYLVKQS